MKNYFYLNLIVTISMGCINRTPHTEPINNSIPPTVINDGYNTADKRNSTGAGNSVENDVSVRSLENYLKSLAGVTILGDQVLIRGIGSFVSSNEPLFIIDNQRFNGNYATLKNIINPNDIKRVSVLTDAASLAVYGSSASNGVIVITMQKGTAN